uniref:Tetraspanin n=1 Tax=Mesocestoides corti TaxID=53468 RepID=A0A5K3FML6_MESCO
MGCVISCGLKLVLQVFNTVLCIAFLLVALIGLLLRTSSTFVQSILNKVFAHIQHEQAEKISNFVIQNSKGISTILIVVGLALAALCLVGCIASCCGCSILLIVYAAVLALLVVAQIVAVSYISTNPNKVTQYLVDGMDKLLVYYNNNQSREHEAAKSIWDALMSFDPICCGMNNYTDLTVTDLPEACCNHTTTPNSPTTCNKTSAQSANVPGCKAKINNFTMANLNMIKYVGIGAILLQAALFVITILTICL